MKKYRLYAAYILEYSVYIDLVSICYLDSFRAFSCMKILSRTLPIRYLGSGGGGDIFTKFPLMTAIYINTKGLY